MTQPPPTILGVGMAALLDCDGELALSELHPTSQAGFRLVIHDDGGVITSAEMQVGFMHRGFEKLFESRDYRQLMMLANRYDWLAAFSSELVIALVLEEAMGILPPERATWTRMLLAEANRISAALAFLCPVLGESAGPAPSLLEQLITAQERATGGRVHPMYCRIGGVAAPVAPDALAAYTLCLDGLDAALAEITEATAGYSAGLAGLATLGRQDAVALATSGVVGRASGLDLDLRRDAPYLAYAELADAIRVPIRAEGDARARYEVLVDQLPTSLALMRASIDALSRLGSGPVNVPLPKTVRAPEGTSYGWIEGPLGISGALLVSVGDSMPWRLKLRSASFASAQAMPVALRGTSRDRLADAVMSFFLSIGDIDR